MPKKPVPKLDKNGQPIAQPVSIPQKEIEQPEISPKHLAQIEAEEKEGLAEVSQYLKEADVKPELGDDLKALGVISTDQRLEETFGGKEAVHLSLTEEEIKKGLHHKVIDSIRWLAEWSVKVIKWAHQKGIQVILGKGTPKSATPISEPPPTN